MLFYLLEFCYTRDIIILENSNEWGINMKRVISIIMVLAMLASVIPANVSAEGLQEEPSQEEVQQEQSEQPDEVLGDDSQEQIPEEGPKEGSKEPIPEEDLEEDSQEQMPEEDQEVPTILSWEEYRYTLLADGSVSICGFEGAPENEEEQFLVKIPSEISGAEVTQIAEKAFAGNAEIEGVLLPKTIQAIGSGAFEDCKNLKVIAFCGDAPSFGESLVKGSEKLGEIDILEKWDFSALTELLEKDLEENAAANITFQSFETVASLEEAFAAPNQPEPEESESNEDDTGTQTGQGYVMYTTGEDDGTEDDTVVANGTCGENLTWYLDNTGMLTISGTGDITSYAFYNLDYVVGIILPESLSGIGDHAFTNCAYFNDTSNWDGTVLYIGSWLIDGTDNPTDTVVGNGYTKGDYAIKEGTIGIADNAFRGCAITSIDIPHTVKYIGNDSFYSCRSLKEVTLPESLIRVGENAFYDCVNLTSILIPDGTQCIDRGAFCWCGLSQVIIPASVKYIGNSAFYGCNKLDNIFYAGSEEQWAEITIGTNNSSLQNATIHYNSTGPDDVSASGDVRYFSRWDAENQIAYFETDPQEDPLNFGCQVTEETDTSFLENVDELLGTYVLVESKNRDDGMIGPDILLSIKPVTTKYGVITDLLENGTVVIDDSAFQLEDRTSTFALSVGDAVMYHLLGDCLVGSVKAQKLSMCGTVSNLDADTATIQYAISSEQYSISPFTSEETIQSLETSVQEARKIDFFAHDGVVYQAKIHSDPYDVPGIEFDYDQQQDPAEGYVYDYRDKWEQAYKEYAEAVIAALQSYAGNTETQKRDVIKAQAKAMKEHDETEYDKYIIVPATKTEDFKKYKDNAYEALSTYFYEEISGYSVPELNAINPKEPLSGAKFVNKFLQNIGKATTKTYIIDGEKFEIKPYAEGMGILGLGSMVINDSDLKVTIGNSQADIQETVVAFLEELQSYTKKQTYKAVDIFYTETDALGIYKVSKKSLSNIESKIKTRLSVVWDEVVENTGLGDLMKDLDTCYNYYRFANQAIDTLSSEDIQEALKNISELINFEEKTIKDAAVSKAMDKLKDAAKKLDRSLVEYMDGTIVDKENSFWRLFFNCPVNVAVFNSAGEQIGYIGEDDLWYSDGMVIRRVGESKEIIILTGDLPTFIATATDYGTMNVVLEEYDDGIPTGRLNYYDIALDPGKNFSITPTGDIHADADTLALQSDSGPIYASEYISAEDSAAVNISCSVEGADGPTTHGAGAYVRGNPVVVYAKPVDGYDFIGWYENGSLVSDSIAYSFTARGDRALTARFRQDVTVYVGVTYGDGGIAVGGGRYNANRIVTVFALPDSGYVFNGWYINGVCVSRDEEYCFEASENVELEAQFMIQMHTHTYSTPEFSWSKDYNCSATFTCESCEHVEIVDCTVSSITTPPTEAGKTVYTATVEFNGQTYTDTVTIANSGEVRVNVNGIGLNASDEVWIDGVKCFVQSDSNGLYVALPDANARTLVTYSYNNPNAVDVHTKYPTGMKVWTLAQENGVYSATYVSELDNLLQYSGSSIRITGNKGIRMITSTNQDTRNKLTGNGLAGFKLLEYGTLIAQTSKLGDDPLVLGGANVKSNYAYKRGVADPIFKDTGSLIQYTNVLVGFTDEDCKEDIAMRPYIILEDENGDTVTIYGGIVYRSIGYIAYQNRKAFTPGSAAYEYVWNIIHYVYGKQYDADYKK